MSLHAMNANMTVLICFGVFKIGNIWRQCVSGSLFHISLWAFAEWETHAWVQGYVYLYEVYWLSSPHIYINNYAHGDTTGYQYKRWNSPLRTYLYQRKLIRLRATVKWCGFNWNFLAFFFCQRVGPTYNFETIVFQRFYRLLVAQETPWVYLTHTVSYSWL